jgi:hypothetical protein
MLIWTVDNTTRMWIIGILVWICINQPLLTSGALMTSDVTRQGYNLGTEKLSPPVALTPDKVADEPQNVRKPTVRLTINIKGT